VAVASSLKVWVLVADIQLPNSENFSDAVQDGRRIRSTGATGHTRFIPFPDLSRNVGTDIDDPGDEEVTPPVNISLSLGESGDVWVARDKDTGVTSQGQTREVALENLDEAVAGYHGAGESPSDEVLREMGIDPKQNTSRSLDESDVFQ
jgi:predicted RNase H-like HicB family nuclease